MAKIIKCKCGRPAHPAYGSRCENCYVASFLSEAGSDYYEKIFGKPIESLSYDEKLSASIFELKISEAQANVLFEAGIRTIKDLITAPENRLLEINRIGATTLTHLMKKLHALGLRRQTENT